MSDIDELLQIANEAEAAGDIETAVEAREMIETLQAQPQTGAEMAGDSRGALGQIAEGVTASMMEPGAMAAGGITGAVTGLLTGDAAAGSEVGQQVSAELAEKVQPETPLGKKTFETINDLTDLGIDVVNYPISGLMGLVDAANTLVDAGFTVEGLKEAGLRGAQTQQMVREQGVGATLGERVFEETGSPLLAAGASSAPAGLAVVAGKKAIEQGRKGPSTNPATIDQPRQTQAEWLEGIRQSKKEQKAAELLEAGEADVETVGYELIPAGRPDVETGTDLAPVGGQAGTDLAPTRQPLVQKSKVDNKALDQGWKDSTVAAVKVASSKTRAAMLNMLAIRRESMRSDIHRTKNRPTDVAGKAFMDRVRDVLALNKEAANRLDVEANKLKGQQVDVTDVVDSFANDLGGMGVKLVQDEDGQVVPDFKGSDIEGIAGAERLVTALVDRMRNSQTPLDAYEVHRLKRYIDEQVSYGKTAEGLTGKTETIIKGLRRNLDQRLDDNFEGYNQVNTQYADTIQAIDALQNGISKKIDLTGDKADSALGTELNKLMSNYATRTILQDGIDAITGVAGKYGKSYDLDIDQLVNFANRIDERLGTTEAGTSLQGRMEAAQNRTGQAAADIAAGSSVSGRIVREGKAIVEDLTTTEGKKQRKQRESDIAALEAMRELLKAGNK